MGSNGRSPGRTQGIARVVLARVMLARVMIARVMIARVELSRTMVACVLATSVMLVAACADSGADGNGGSSGPTATTSPTSSAVPTGPTPTGPADTGPAITTGPAGTSKPPVDLPGPSPSRIKGVRTVTVSGTLEQGVEANCVLLGNYLLLGGPRQALRPGLTVTVTGRLALGMVTTCQQGTPLIVDRVVG
jgi:hypothetical protein